MKAPSRFLLLLLILSVVSCRQTGTMTEADLFTGEACSAPCWQGLKPGQSVSEDVERLLQRTDPLTITVSEYSPRSECRIVEVGVQRTHNGFDSRGVYIEDDRVTLIEFTPGFVLPLKRVIARFGEPEFIEAVQKEGPEGPYFTLDIFYPTLGLGFELSTQQQVAGYVKPNMAISRVQYFSPGDLLTSLSIRNSCGLGQSRAQLIAQDELRLIQPWSGYGKVKVIETQ